VTVILIPVILVVIVAVVVLLALASWGRRRQSAADELAHPASPTLDYRVPPGQDPVVVLTALASEGYQATVDPEATQLVHISCPAGLDRERAHVRAVLESADTTTIDTGAPIDPTPVRFVDES
jgi:hypothetical protein